MKKRIICFLLVFAMLIPFSAGIGEASAGEMKLVYIPEKGISIAVPADYITVGRDTETLDPVLASVGMTLEDIQADMKNRDIYLTGFAPDFSSTMEVAVSPENMLPSVDFDLEGFITGMYDALDANLSGIGITLIRKDIYRHDDDLFLLAIGTLTDDPDTIYMQGRTAADGRAFSIVVCTYDGEYTDDDENLLKAVLSASVLKKHGNPETADAASETAEMRSETTDVTSETADEAPKEYYHEETGLHFDIPNGWTGHDVTGKQIMVKMQMSPAGDDMADISFACQDIWPQISATIQSAYGASTREEFDSMIDRDFISKFGEDAEQFEVKEYNGIFWGTGMRKQELYGKETDVLSAFTIRNGYYIFLILTDFADPLRHADTFYAVLESAYFD